MTNQRSATGKGVFWVASILVIMLLAIYMMVSTRVTQYDFYDLGLFTKLPATYWIGLSYLGVLLYLGRKSGLRTIVVAVLISFYLFGVPVLISENKAIFLGGISYFQSYQGTQLLSTGHLDLGTLYSLNPLNWPGFYILAGLLSASTGLSVTLFADYFSLLTMALLGILAYKTLRLQLNTLLSSFGALWFIASFWTSQNYFAPQGIAYVIYFAIFLFLARLFFTKKQNIVFPLIVFVLFIGLVGTHLLTSFMLAIGVIAIYVLSRIFSRKHKIAPFYSIGTCILIVCIFFAYQALLITQSLSGIAEILYSQFLRGETHLPAVSARVLGQVVRSPALQLTLLGSYGITIITAVIAVIGILTTAVGILLYKKVDAKNDLFWIAWIIVAGIIGVSVTYGGEAINRAFILMLLPTCYFAAKFFSKKSRILIIVLILIIFLQIPALYGSQNYVYMPTSELRGGAFFVRYVPSGAPFFYEPNLAFFGPGIARAGTQLNLQSFVGANSIPRSEIIDYITGQAEFVISSSEQNNFYQYYYRVNLLENLSLVDTYSQIYDNGAFQIYARLSG